MTDTPRPRLLTLAEVDGDLRLLTEALPHVTAAKARRDIEIRIDALRALRAAMVAEDVEALRWLWVSSAPCGPAPEWPGQSGVGAS